ncbi:MAG: hypothetical protein KDE59_03440 [Anaerolineales bacterium]|nr:hypothetical protein [Anaerolineales bacterium]
MNIRCTSCRRDFNLSQDWLQYAIEKADAKKHKYFNADCPHCRRAVRVPVDQMKRNLVESEADGE